MVPDMLAFSVYLLNVAYFVDLADIKCGSNGPLVNDVDNAIK